ncbi:MAG: peptidoglycan bridge formation glycyltransferase FemA/FemB family protein [Pirellulales bacterium]|nr:peptidoglycan bridge formation glycyltransferase FemA/FemB family protein [Pirellulales bacterium]
MKIDKIITTAQLDIPRWDSLAAKLQGGYYHCHAPAISGATRIGADPLFVKAMDNEQRCIGLTTGRMVTPFGWPFSCHCRSATILALPALADQSVDGERIFMETLEMYLRAEGVCIVNVFSHDSPNAQRVLSELNYKLSPRTEFYVDLRRSEEEIWDGFKSERRTNIRRACKHGVQTRIENTEKSLDLVYHFFYLSMKRHGIEFGKTRERTRRARLECFQSGHIDVMVSYQNDTPINGAIFGNFNGRPYYVMSGASPQGYKVGGPAHLIWTAIMAYRERGAVSLNLGAAMKDEATYRFKRDFGTKIVSQPMGKKILSTFGARLLKMRALLRLKRA